MIRVGIVGLGGICQVHIGAHESIEDVKIVAAADLKGKDARNYNRIEKHNVNVYTSLKDMLDNEEIDVVDICTPSYTHMALAKEALSRGVHVICEKPISQKIEDTQEVIDLAKKMNKRFMVAHVVRFMKPYMYLASIVKSGELGRPVHLMFRRLSSNPKWSFDWVRNLELSGGATIDLSIHDIDFVCSLFGEPTKFSSVYRPYKDDSEYGLNDFITSNLIYDGFTVNVTGTFYKTSFPFTAEYVAIFENGYVELKNQKLYRCGEEVILDNVNESDSGVNVVGTNAYFDEVAYFMDCVRKGVNPDFVTPESAQSSLNLALRLRTEGNII